MPDQISTSLITDLRDNPIALVVSAYRRFGSALDRENSQTPEEFSQTFAEQHGLKQNAVDSVTT